MEFSQRQGLKPSIGGEGLPFEMDDAYIHSFGLSDPFPPEVILPSHADVRDQTDIDDPSRDVPCCVSMSLVQAMESLDLENHPATGLSPLFNYFSASNGVVNSGLSIFDGLRSAVRLGVCRADLHDPPMSRIGAGIVPSAQAKADAIYRRLAPIDITTYKGGYVRLRPASLDQWVVFLAAGSPLIVGFFMSGS